MDLPRRLRRLSGQCWSIGFLLLCSTSAAAAKGPAEAELHVRGYGLLGDLQLKHTLELLETAPKKPEFFDANFIEDAALILFSRVQRDGYLIPHLSARVTLEDGRRVDYTWTKAIRDEPLPRPMRARKIEFKVFRGVLYYFGKLEFQELSVLKEERAKAYFIETSSLLQLKFTRIYSPAKLERGLVNMTETLNRLGYESAEVKATHIAQDDRTGRVDVSLAVRPGSKSMLRSVREEFYFPDSADPKEVLTLKTNVPFSNIWLQDFVQRLEATNFHGGYPDTKVDTRQQRRKSEEGTIEVDLVAQVHSGPQVWLGKVKFQGEKRTKKSLLEQRVHLTEGSLLDRVLIEEGRNRLARLGVFDTVGLNYDRVDDHKRDVTYQLKEGKSLDVSLLFGWGSYELLRGGIEVDQNNLFGVAHRARLLLTQSFKASYGEYVYTIPELIGHDVDLFINGSALRREEITFTREEYGGGFGARKYLKPIESDVTVRYSYQVLNATAPGLPVEAGLPEAAVGAVITEIRHDQVDNLLYPRKGYRTFGNFEVGSEYFGGDVNYQRLEIGGSFHLPLDTGRWLHLGLSHGAVLTIGSPAQDLPFNRRFFPGGDNSIRGYQQGEAAPRDSHGNIVGAESYLFGSIELEQALTSSWSLVGFFDTVSFAQQLKDYPFNESLYSVGLGLSWKTIVGPVRLEYGYNLNPRSGDPIGTLQFSVGFPF